MEEEYENRTASSNFEDRGMLKLAGKVKKGFDIPVGEAAVEQHLTALGKDLLKEFKRKPGQKFSTFANLVLTPEATGVKLQKPGSLKLGYKECWVTSPSVVIDKVLFVDIVDEMIKQGQPVGHSIKSLIKELS